MMEGAVVNSEFVASLPMLPSGTTETSPALRVAIDTPTSLTELTDLDIPFKGKIPMPQTASKSESSPLDVNYSPLDKDKELLLGGICCTADCWDGAGVCDVEKIEKKISTCTVEDRQVPKMTIVPPNYTTPPDENTSCVVCRWLQAGPCAVEYNDWDASMKAFMADQENSDKKAIFFATATIMSTCVRKHEYYDVYTAFL
jgi:hypothetical protein